MKQLQLILLLIISCVHVSAQLTLAKKWDKRFGGTNDDVFLQVYISQDSGLILVGYSASDSSGDRSQNSRGNYDYWIVKADASGNKLWDKRLGGNLNDFSASWVPSTDGGYLIGGATTSGVGGDRTQALWGGSDIWILKIDANNNIEWDKRYGGTADESVPIIKKTADGGYIVACFSTSGIGGDKTQDNWDSTGVTEDYWIVKIDSTGTKQWDKRFGGDNDDVAADIVLTSDGGYLVGGMSLSGISGDKTQSNYGPGNFWVVKMDSAGNKLWDRVYGGTGGEQLLSILNTSHGGYLLGGESGSPISGDVSQGKTGYWVIKIDSAGNKIWDRCFGGLGTMNFRNMTATNDGGYLLTGESGTGIYGDKTEANLGPYQVWVVRIDSDGNKIWDKTIFSLGGDQGVETVQTSDGCYVVAVQTFAGIGGYKTQPNWDTTTATVTYDYWIVKLCDTTISGIFEKTGDINFSIYPNPTANDVSIMLQKDGLKEATFTLTNVSGQIIYQSDETHLSSTYTKMLDLTNLPTGTYFLNVNADGERISRKIVKE